MRVFLALITFICLIHTNVQAEDKPPFVLAIEDSWPPYADEYGQGYSRVIVEEAFRAVDLAPEIQTHPYARALYLAEKGLVNGCFNVTRQKSTEAVYHFGEEPLLIAPASFFIRPDYVLQAKTLKDLPDDFKIGVITGYEYGDIFEEEKHRLKVSDVRTQEQLIQMIKLEHVDGIIMFDEVARYYFNKLGLSQNNLERAFTNHVSDIYIAFTKDNPASKYLSKELDKGLKILKNSRKYNLIFDLE